MARKKEWNLEIDGNMYNVVLERSLWLGKIKIYINEVEQGIINVPFQTYKGLDHPIYIGGKECRLVVLGNMADIVMDGVLVDSGKAYMPFLKTPLWTWIFIVGCLAIPVINQGGLIPAALGILGSVYCIRIGVSPYMKTKIKVLASLGVVLAAWVLWFIFAVLIVLSTL